MIGGVEIMKENYSNLNPWEILVLKRGASKSEIKRAYKRLAMKYHPDRNKSVEAEEMFKRVNWAYKKLVGSAPDDIVKKKHRFRKKWPKTIKLDMKDFTIRNDNCLELWDYDPKERQFMIEVDHNGDFGLLFLNVNDLKSSGITFTFHDENDEDESVANYVNKNGKWVLDSVDDM